MVSCWIPSSLKTRAMPSLFRLYISLPTPGPGTEWLLKNYLLKVSEACMESTHLVRLSELVGIFFKKTQGSKVAVNNHFGCCNKVYSVLQLCPGGETVSLWSVTRLIGQIPICSNLQFVKETALWSSKSRAAI